MSHRLLCPFVLRHPLRLLVPLALLVLLIPATTGPQGLLAVPTSAPGGTATLLPDGRWLLLGGEGRRGPLASASIWSPSTQTLVPLAAGLDTARAWHTATVLPDGTVLVLGGLDGHGRVVTNAERFDPATETFAPLALAGITRRAQHTTTVLTDARVLIAGGVVQGGRATASAELWNPATGAAEAIHGGLDTARRDHTATLLPDGTVWITGGVDPHDAGVASGEVFDPGSAHFTGAAPPSLPDAQDLPQLAGSLPTTGATDVPLDGVMALRFSKPLRVETVTPTTVLLSGPIGLEAASVVAAEGGRLAFVTPEVPLVPNSAYTVSINGAIDATGFLVPPTAVSFRTAGTAAAGGGAASAETGGSGSATSAPSEHRHDHRPHASGTPAELDDWDYDGERSEGKPSSPWQTLPPLQAPPGVTALAGQVLKLNGQPLADVTLRIGARSVRTDPTGRFLLTDIPAGYPALTMDGATASRRGRTYGTFTYGVHVDAGKTNVLPWTIWLPLIDTQHAVTIPVPTPHDIVVTTPHVPGLEMRIPAGVILRAHDGHPLTAVSLTRLPLDRTPFPLPKGTTFFFTPQTHGARVLRADGTPSREGVRFILPNVERLAPGVRVDLTQYTTTRGWHVYGQGTVRRDGRQIMPDPGVQFLYVGCIINFGGEGGVPPSWDPPGGLRDADPVGLATGLFVLERADLVIPDVIPIVLTRTYRPNDHLNLVRPFGTGASHPYSMSLIGDSVTYTYAEMVRADGSRIRFNRISPGTGYADAIMEHTATPTAFYQARLSFNVARHGWDVAQRDGTVYEFSSGGPPGLVGIRDRWGNRLRIEAVAPGQISRITSPNGRWIEFTYGPGQVITQVRDHANRTVNYEYVGAQLTAMINPAGGRTEYTYAPNARLATIKDPRGIVVLTNEYDAAGRVTRQTFADGSSYQFAYTLDENGKIIQTDVTNPRGFVRRVTFNANGYPLTDTAAYGTALAQTTTYVRDSANRPTSITDALGRRTDYTYDALGNVLTVTRLAGTGSAVTTTFTYEPTFNQVASVTDPLNHTTTFTYDTLGNLTTVTNPLGHQVTSTYNAVGQPVTVTTPAGTTTFTYDGPDVVTGTDPTGKTTKQVTDTLGRRIAVTGPAGQRTRYEYNAVNRVTKATDPLGSTTQFSYDPIGNPLSLTDARSNATSYAYNSMGRRTSRTDPHLRAETYAYDSNGNLTSFTDRKSQMTSRIYDALDRLTQVTYADSSTTSYTWDAGNRVTQITDSVSGTITRTYDLLDRLTQETTPQGSVSYTYDAAGRRTTMTVAGQPTVSYGYDDANRLTSITQGSAVFGYAYDTAGRRTTLTLPNGISTEYAYDAASRLVGLTYKYGSTTLGTLTYGYDANGSRRQLAGTWARTGLSQAVASATYDAANRPLTFGSQMLTHDLNGNLTGDGTTTYTWDARDRLSSLTGPGLTASFQYDAAGRRSSKTVNATTTSALHDGLDAAQESTSGTVRNILTGGGIDEYLSHASTSGESRFALADALGSTIALVDASGSVVTEYIYQPFGATTISGTASENRTQYTGRENDGTGLYYYRARYYHPGLQRFISEDPIGFAGGDVNLYAYVLNAPVQLVDPLGLLISNGGGDEFECALNGVCDGSPPLDCPDSSPPGTVGCDGPNPPENNDDDDDDSISEAGFGGPAARLAKKLLLRSLRLDPKRGGGGKLQPMDTRGRYAYDLPTTIQRELYKSDAAQLIIGISEGYMYPAGAVTPMATRPMRAIGREIGSFISNLLNILPR